MTFEKVAERLRNANIWFSLDAYNGGFSIQIYDVGSYHHEDAWFETMDEAAKYLHEAARKLYPDTYGKEKTEE